MLQNLDFLFGKRNGIINNLINTYLDGNEPEIFSFAASRGLLNWEKENKEQALNIAGGGGFTEIEALLSCCGEIAERYCSSFTDKEDIEGSYNELKAKYNIINPEFFNHFSKKQYTEKEFPFQKITKDSPLIWTKTLKNTKEEIYLPAFAIYLPFNNYERGGKHFFSMSTGLSCAESVEKASIKGILEIIERDAFTNFWINQLSPPIIKLPNNDKYNNLKKIFKFQNIQYIILDITSDFGIPTIATFSFGNSSFGYVASLGLACDFTYYGAIKKSLIENAQGRISVAFNRKTMGKKEYRKDFLDVMSFKDHSYLYSTKKELKNKINFIEKGDKIDLNNQRNKNKFTLKELIKMINKKGYNIYFKDLTTKDIETSVGFKVVRSVIPGLTQLHGIHAYPFLGSEKLYHPNEVFKWCNKSDVKESELQSFPPHMLG